MMMEFKASRIFFAGLAVFAVSALPAAAGDQAKAIVNGIDPKSMNQLLEMSKSQPDAALTNMVPLSANKFRFLFIWPASNPLMTYDRIGRSFAERFLGLTDSLKLLATGYCLSSKTMFFGSTPYAGEEVNVAYRDIEVRYQAGWQAPCAGRYIAAAELEQAERQPPPDAGLGAGFPLRTAPSPGAPEGSPEESLKPFLNPVPASP